MPRPLWKGAISFGMVSIPVRLYAATEEKDVRFNLLHAKDRARIKQQRFCPEDEEVIPWDDVVRGYEIAPNQYVVIDDEDFENVPVTTTHAIEITQFVSLEEIDPVYYQKTYFLEPEEVGLKPFALLMRVLKETDRVAVAKVTLRQKEQLCTLRVYQNTIALETMFYGDEVRSSLELQAPGEEIAVTDRELTMAKSLVDMLAGEFDPTSYKDGYREALMEIIRKKAEGEVIATPQPAVARVTDLMEALRASVEEARRRKGAAGQPEEEDRPARIRKVAG